ncbi:unnamed protein product [Paramecium pentaurelia]|uniref:Uncharacterized protein n=1 Tax=Paramecium pentaurelia TaxID=43138 RepID=A0A8S1XYC3_9CILI|nr:unnamed protein product [Paramecium pentaurelia]
MEGVLQQSQGVIFSTLRHYRIDSMSQTLNIYDRNLCLKDHPTIQGIAKTTQYLLGLWRSQGNLYIWKSIVKLKYSIIELTYPQTIAEIFKYDRCNFTEIIQIDQLKNEVGSVERVLLVYSFQTSIIPFEMNKLMKQCALRIQQHAMTNQTYLYTINDYEQVGETIILVFIDINYFNPCSRIPDSQFNTLVNINTFLAYNIMEFINFRFELNLMIVLKYLTLSNQKKQERILTKNIEIIL